MGGISCNYHKCSEICQVEDRFRSLEVEKDADLAIFDGNPMETFTNMLYTIIDGEIVYKRDVAV